MGGYFIYKRGQWLELDLDNGLVDGQKVRFARVRRGKIELARSKKVLKGLKALAEGKPGVVTLGAQVPCRRRRLHKPHKKYHIDHCRQHCCSHSCHQPVVTIQQNSNVQYNKCTTTIPQINTPQNDVPPQRNASQNVEKVDGNDKVNEKVVKTNEEPDSSEVDSGETPCKELFIDIDDVDYIKKYAAEHPKFLQGFDLTQFEKNETYRNLILFKVNPLVKVEKSRRVDKMNQDYYKRRNEMSLKEFAAELGLTHIDDKQIKRSYRTRQRNITNYNTNDSNDSNSGDTNKENNSDSTSDEDFRKLVDKRREGTNTVNRKSGADSHKKNNLRDDRKGARILRERDTSDKNMSETVSKKSEKQEAMGVKRKRTKSSVMPKMSNPREYSSLEDHAIVAWVSVGGRERQVNGNTIWRELQDQYCNITGHSRSWHSLRNRYLRYILPMLGKMRLNTDHESRLRAAAVKGQIKLTRKKGLNRRNSMFETTQVQSAWTKKDGSKQRPQTRATTLSPGDRKVDKDSSIANLFRRQLENKRSKQQEVNAVKNTSNNTKSNNAETKTRKSIDRALIESSTVTNEGRELRNRASLTYSSITRAFNEAHQHSNASSPSESPIVPQSSEPAFKKRRLFNPNLLKQ